MRATNVYMKTYFKDLQLYDFSDFTVNRKFGKKLNPPQTLSGD